MDGLDRAGMQQLVSSGAWQRWMVHLYRRYQGLQGQLHTATSDHRFHQGKLSELMWLMNEPYEQAGYQSPFAVVSEAQVREWLGDVRAFEVQKSPEQRIEELEHTIAVAQADLERLRPPVMQENPALWRDGRTSSPV